MTRQPQCVYIHPFSWGEPSETLFYIPPTNKGDVDEGIAGVRLISLSNSILSPHEKGSIETPSVYGSAGWRHE